jgi:ribosomal protein S18 acetylase RimI-like enzyme
VAEIGIRPFEKPDIDGLRALYMSVWLESYGQAAMGTARDFLLQAIEDPELSSKLFLRGEKLLLAIHGNSIIGCVTFVTTPGLLRLWGLFVAPHALGLGTGAALMQAVRKACNPGDKVEAIVMGHSPAAVSFFSKHGFMPQKRAPFSLLSGMSIDALVMTN